MKIWYLHISYNIFNLRHVSKVPAQCQKKNKMFIYSFKYPNEEIFKKQGCRAVFRALSKIGHFCENATAKTFIIDVWYGSKYTPEVVQDS